MTNNYAFNKVKTALQNNETICLHFVSADDDVTNYRFYKIGDSIVFDTQYCELNNDGAYSIEYELCAEPSSLKDIQKLILSSDVAGEWSDGWYDGE
jgi:hypothetical protein